MSGYCVLADVKREMGRYAPNLTGISVPSTNDTESIIDVIAGEINGVLAAKGISTPVTVPPNPTTVSGWITGFLKRLNAIGAAGVVLQGMFGHATGPASSNLGPDKTAEYRRILEMLLKDFSLIPNDIVLVPTSGHLPRSLWTDGDTDSEAVAQGTVEFDPIFTRVTEW